MENKQDKQDMQNAQNTQNEDVQLWKIKKLVKELKNLVGNGTSVVSIILKANDPIHKMIQKLTDELGASSNIKSSVNKKAVMSAITSAQQRLKLYSKCPPNGLIIFSGEVLGADGKEKKITLDIEPFKPLNTSTYICDNKFFVEPLEELLHDDKKYAFVIVDGNGYMLVTLSGNNRQVLDKKDVNLMTKSSRGGQSSNRYARLRDEERNAYVKMVCERLRLNLVVNNKVNVEGIIMAGSASIKDDILNHNSLDPLIKRKVLSVVDVAYGGLIGFNHAVTQSKELLSSMQYVIEQKLLSKYLTEIAKDTGMYTFGCSDTIKALEAGAVDTLIVHDNLKIEKITVKNNGIIDTIYFDPDNPRNTANSQMEFISKQSLMEFLIENCHAYGATIKFVSENTSEGSQFAKGFGGIGSILRYKLDLEDYGAEDEDAWADESDTFSDDI